MACGGTPSALAISLGMAKRGLEQPQRVLGLKRHRRIGRPDSPSLNRLRRLYSVPGEKLTHEILVLLRDVLDQRACGGALVVLDREILRDEHVDAVGLAIDVIVDPLQFELELIERERGCAQHAETARPADASHHVAAVTESQQREIDAEHLADRCLHYEGSLRLMTRGRAESG